MVLNNEEMLNVRGGAIKAGVLGLISGAIAFIVGVVSGYLNPRKCN